MVLGSYLRASPCKDPNRSPTVAASAIRAWIQGAQYERGMPGAEEQPQLNEKETARIFLFGALEVNDEAGSVETLQVFVHRKRLLSHRERFILLHFHSAELVGGDKPKDRKEIGFVYFEAAAGTLHGFHIGSEYRGRGLMKLMFFFYVLFSREFDLPALDTACNKKPMFAKLYNEMGYEPCCLDFPFLMFEGHHVLPLPAEDPSWASSSKRGSKWEGDTLWNISQKAARSQAFFILDDPSCLATEHRQGRDGLKLYAKTTWCLPKTEAVSRREVALEDLSRRVRCVMYRQDSCDKALLLEGAASSEDVAQLHQCPSSKSGQCSSDGVEDGG